MKTECEALIATCKKMAKAALGEGNYGWGNTFNKAAGMLAANDKEIQILQAEVDLYRAACDKRDAAVVIVGWRNPLNGVVISDHRKKSISVGKHYPNFSEPVYARTDIPEK